MEKRVKKLKRKVKYLEGNLEFLEERINHFEQKERNSKNLQRRIFLILITTALICFSITFCYSVFFK